MKSIKSLLSIIIVLSLFIIGCGNESKEGKEKANQQGEPPQETSKVDKDKEVNEKEVEVQVEPLPSTYSELENKPVGKDSNYIPLSTSEDKEKAVERFKDLPEIKNDPSEKELDYYYQELLKRVQRDFNGPDSLIKQLKFQSFGNPEIEDPRYQFKENLNVEVILDASGSMAQDAGGQTKMKAAKEEITQFVKNLPEGTKVGLRVYGHKGSNADSDKELSCKSSDILYPIDNYDSTKFNQSLDKVKPTGWTPISLALNDAKNDLSSFNGDKNTNIVYLVSDGIETCDQDPVEAAKELYNSDLTPIINVIGFNVDGEGQRQLKDIADETNGIYSNVEDQAGLKTELEKINNIAEAWKKWKEKGEKSIELKEVQNNLEIFNYIAEEESKSLKEKDQINLLIYTLQQKNLMSKESREYIEKKNNEYHSWIDSEINNFNDELKKINQQSYLEAKEALEEKYQINTQ
ncbi:MULTISPECIES: VWA domain-containing protein [Bacillaceae]|uniref:VWA domain-containing protein n=1 Tax=Bacillaceae TaxID=186817 RepID=UPI001C598BF6|nr:VWA domain-containing protein [Rossellomorea sp. YZS02]MBW3110719.1 VWA domain-containing protein [Bacillus sp. MCCB 382]MDX8346030.1 VWA domain-containing protein [Rossellomorea sp. YZS02]